MTIILDTPEQINAWVLLSRRSQLHLHLQGLKVPGIVKWCKDNIPAEYGKVTTAHNALQYLNDYMGDLDLPEDEWTTFTLLIGEPGAFQYPDGTMAGTWIERGTFDTMEALTEAYLGEWFQRTYVIFRNLPKSAYSK